MARANSNALWEVKRSRGRGVFECEIVNEPIEINGRMIEGDYAGVRKLFDAREIEAASRWQELEAADHEAFYEGLRVGEIVHYHDGFGQYVRCEVVIAETVRPVDHPSIKAGEKCLREIALVGAWREYDLWADSYHARGVREQRLFHPNASCIWENPKFARREGPRTLSDPTAMPALDIRGQKELFA
jgi:hypothetical protein